MDSCFWINGPKAKQRCIPNRPESAGHRAIFSDCIIRAHWEQATKILTLITHHLEQDIFSIILGSFMLKLVWGRKHRDSPTFCRKTEREATRASKIMCHGSYKIAQMEYKSSTCLTCGSGRVLVWPKITPMVWVGMQVYLHSTSNCLLSVNRSLKLRVPLKISTYVGGNKLSVYGRS